MHVQEDPEWTTKHRAAMDVLSEAINNPIRLMLGWFALTFPSGLAVYFITSNVLGIVQYAMMGKANWRNLLPGGQNQSQQKK